MLSEFGWSVDLSASSNIAALGARQQCLVVRILQYNGNKWVDLGQRIKCNDNAAPQLVCLRMDLSWLWVANPVGSCPMEMYFKNRRMGHCSVDAYGCIACRVTSGRSYLDLLPSTPRATQKSMAWFCPWDYRTMMMVAIPLWPLTRFRAGLVPHVPIQRNR